MDILLMTGRGITPSAEPVEQTKVSSCRIRPDQAGSSALPVHGTHSSGSSCALLNGGRPGAGGSRWWSRSATARVAGCHPQRADADRGDVTSPANGENRTRFTPPRGARDDGKMIKVRQGRTGTRHSA